MHGLAVWLTTSRLRALIGAVALAFLSLLLPFGTWLSGALIVLLALSDSKPLQDWLAALVSAMTLGWWLSLAGAGPLPVVLLAAALVVPAWLLGRLLARGGSLNLAFQLATLAALVFLGTVHAVLSDPPGVWRPFLERLASELDQVATVMSNVGSGRSPKDVNLIEASAERMWGVVTWLLLLNTMVALFVGLYWSGIKTGTTRLGPAFRALTAGKTLSALGVLITACALIFRWDVAADAAWVFLGAFVLQGLAVLHAARWSLKWSGAWLGVTYVLLFLPFTTLLVQGVLATVGLADNWLAIRTRWVAPRQS
jgi:hypothetical protein